MRVGIIGTGYVGLVTGTCFSDLGNEVICLDIDEDKINKLKKGVVPIYEPGLSDLIKRNVREKRLSFTIDAKKTIHESDIIFICVGTPQAGDGTVNLEYVKSAAKDIAKHMNGYKIIVNKSTVPVGTAEMVTKIIKDNQSKKIDFDVVSNPEFLKEGSAIKDFFNPDRIVIGNSSKKAIDIMIKLYKPLERVNKPIVVTDVKSAEMIKYASNAFLAMKITFINEVSRLCEKTGADITKVARGVGLDGRIGPRFLHAGIGYGGSCFPKDIRGFVKTAAENNIDFKLIGKIDEVNEAQKQTVLPKLKKLLPELKNKKIAVWGLSFKPKTDDIREAPALIIIKQLQKEGAKVSAFDPEAMENAKQVLKNVHFATNPLEAIKDCDGLIIATEWDEFRSIDKQKIKSLLKQPIIIDGRNIYDPKEMKGLGFKYMGIGRQ